jgi:hypothetical protein
MTLTSRRVWRRAKLRVFIYKVLPRGGAKTTRGKRPPFSWQPRVPYSAVFQCPYKPQKAVRTVIVYGYKALRELSFPNKWDDASFVYLSVERIPKPFRVRIQVTQYELKAFLTTPVIEQEARFPRQRIGACKGIISTPSPSSSSSSSLLPSLTSLPT